MSAKGEAVSTTGDDDDVNDVGSVPHYIGFKIHKIEQEEKLF